MSRLVPQQVRNTCAVLMLLALSVQAPAEERSGRFVIRSWQSEEGLPGSVVRSVVQAADGYLWVATAEGVVRFDGMRFTGFDAEPDATFARIPPRLLFPLNDGSVWVATSRGGLLCWRDHRLRRVWAEAEPAVPQNDVSQVTQVVSDESSHLIVRGRELWRAKAAQPPVQITRTQQLDALLQSDLEAWTRRGRSPPRAAALVLHDRHNRIWTAAAGSGLSVAEAGQPAGPVALSAEETVSRISELHEDREGSIWVAAGEDGLVQIRERRVEMFTATDGLSDRTALAVMEDRSGAFWVAGRHGGVDRIINGEVSHFDVGDGPGRRPVSALWEDRTGTIWVGTRHGTVFHWRDGAFRPAFRPAALSPKAMAIAEDAEGRLWFAGPQGLASLANGSLQRHGPEEGFTALEGSVVISAPDGQLWVGSSDGMVFQRVGAGFKLLGDRESLGGRMVSALLPDAEGGLWVATLGGGLFHWKNGRFHSFSAPEGLPDPRLTAVLEDASGNLWLGSLGGIFRVNKAELAEIASRRRQTAHWLQLDRSDGLISRECSGGYHPSGWRGRDGQLSFPTLAGVARIPPDLLKLNTVPPPVAIEESSGVLVFSSAGAAELKTGPSRSRLSFRFTALSFVAPEKVRFRVQLEGLQKEWIEAGSQRIVAFEAVPPGRYLFRVRAANGDGIWNEEGASMAVHVRPHFWETTWFRSIATAAGVFAAVAAGWAIARARMRRRMARMELQAAREKERARIAQDLHDDLGASLTEISMLAHLAAEDHGKSEGARDPLREIAEKAHALVGALDEIVWAVNPRHDTVTSLADYLAAFASDFLDTAGITLRLDIPRNLPELALDAEQRHGLFLAMREALNNVVKHAGATEVWLRLRLDDRQLELELQDNGCGIASNVREATDGLRNMHARLASLGGTCRIDSAPGEGTSVCFSFALPAESHVTRLHQQTSS